MAEDQQERLVSVLETLEKQTKKQVSLKFTFIKGLVYGLGTVIGASVLISVVSYLFVSLFGGQ
jgi:hypothetical protein